LRLLREELEVSSEQQKSSIYAQAAQARLMLEEDSRKVATEISQHILHRPY
jgi:hypothetical protein